MLRLLVCLTSSSEGLPPREGTIKVSTPQPSTIPASDIHTLGLASMNG